jgi:hypothetical protein
MASSTGRPRPRGPLPPDDAEPDRGAWRGDEVGEGGALDELHDDRERALTLFQPVDVRDVRMVERGERRGQDLDRDVALELGVARAIDLAHAAFAEQGGDVVRTEPRARRECHRRMRESGRV